MAPSPIPAPLPPWARAAIWLTPIVGGYLYDNLTHSNDAPSVLQWRKLAVRAHPTGASAVVADDAFTSFDLVNITGGNVDTSWTTSDYTTCEALFDTFWNSYKPLMMSGYSITEYRWYTREFSDVGAQFPFLDSGPPQRTTTKAITGTATAPAPSQCAFALTEKTGWPKHWGRTYLPFFAPTGMSWGRYTTSVVDATITAASTLYAGLATAEFFPMVPVTQIDKDPARVLLNVTQVQGDDLPDIVRRRRPKYTAYRKVLP